MGLEIQGTENNFKDEVLNSNIPVLVDFWADWCVPCKMIAPILEEIAKDYEGKIKIVKLNIDEAADVASQYSIVSIPTLLLFNKGEVVEKYVGAGSKDAIEGLFKDLL